MRKLGDTYVKQEFAMHKKTSKPEFLEKFYFEWDTYLNMLGKQSSSFGKDLDENHRNEMTADQKEKLQDLKNETKNLPV